MSAFNPDTFLQTELNGATDTEYLPVPEGEWVGRIDKMTPRVLSSGQVVLDIVWVIDEEEVRQSMDQAEPRARQTVWLDVDESGGLDFGRGKNVQLGRLRAAVNQNNAGEPWQPNMLLGQTARCTIKHRLNTTDNSMQADVKSVAAL